MKKIALLILGTVGWIMASSAQATTLNSMLTADNGFRMYISTDDTTRGTLIGSGSDWMTTYNFSNIALNVGQTNYLHIEADDFGVVAGLIGQFTLSDNQFSFVNGGQSLLTNTVDWMVNQTGFNNPYTAAVLWGGANDGSDPWRGIRPGIASGAQWIWDKSNCLNCTAYFSTAIRFNGVPEPSIVLLFGMGLLMMWRVRQPVSVH